MNAQIKKYASIAFVFVLVSVLATLGHVAVPLLPPLLQPEALGLIGAALHGINTWGHGERIMAAVDNAFNAGARVENGLAGSAAGLVTSPAADSPEGKAAIAAIKSACTGADPNGCPASKPLPPDTAA